MIFTSFRRTNDQSHSRLFQFVLLFSISIAFTKSQLEFEHTDSSGNFENYYYDYYNIEKDDAPDIKQHSEKDKSVLVTTTSPSNFNLDDYYDYNQDFDEGDYGDYKDAYDPDMEGHVYIDPVPKNTGEVVTKHDSVDNVETSTQPHTTQRTARSKLLAIMAKPGILAGIVGGAIIGVLTAILLIMFIVYRMRKKDEGSYALEETKKPLNAYDYRHCPTKEFYA